MTFPIRRLTILVTMSAVMVISAHGVASAMTPATPTRHVPAPVLATSTMPLKTANTPLGRIVTDARGRTVYVFAADSKGKSACTGPCLDYWPIVKAPRKLPAKVPGITARLGVLVRADGLRQLTLNGAPLYTYAGDTARGQTNGQGVNGSGARWWVVSPAGKRITSTSAGGTASTSATTTSSAPTVPGY